MTGLCACLCRLPCTEHRDSRLPCKEHRDSKQKLKKSTTPLCFHQAHSCLIYGMSTGRQLNLKCPGRRSRTCSVQSQVSQETLSAGCHSTDLPHELSVLPRHAPMPAICTKVTLTMPCDQKAVLACVPVLGRSAARNLRACRKRAA